MRAIQVGLLVLVSGCSLYFEDDPNNAPPEVGGVVDPPGGTMVPNDPIVTRVDPEPAGANCELGGSVVSSGHDANHDGTLEDAEIETTVYVCKEPVVVDGDVYIYDWADLQKLDGVNEITGSLIVNSATVTTLVATDLHRVGKAITCGAYGTLPCKLDTLVLPSLQHAGQFQLCKCGCNDITSCGVNGISTLELPALQSMTSMLVNEMPLSEVALPSLVSGDITLDLEDSVQQVALPSLQTGLVMLSNTSGIQSLELPNLQTGAVRALNCAGLTSVSAPLLSTGHGGTYLDDDPNLTTISLPALAYADHLEIKRLPQLGALSLPALYNAGELVIVLNDALSTLDLPSLAPGNGRFMISGNPALPACHVEALWEQAGHPTPVSISGNDDAATCTSP